MNQTLSRDEILGVVEQELRSIPFIDVHTHLFMPSLGELGLWGIDELVTYHYLEAELFRSSPISPEEYFALSTRDKADLIWRTLFIENEPLSEATRGVVAVLNAFRLPTSSPDLVEAREFFTNRNLDAHIKDVFNIAGISEVVMTNDPLDPAEGPRWEAGVEPDPMFHAALRLDGVLNRWSENWGRIAPKGYAVDERCSNDAIAEVRRFLADWIRRMNPVYAAVSLPDTFQFPEDSVRGRLLAGAVLPACREFDLPLSLMIGVRYQVNPRLKLAGDAVGRADLRSLEHLAAAYPDNRFLVSVLSRENQHELCVYVRKFRNVLVFGCWWFLNSRRFSRRSHGSASRCSELPLSRSIRTLAFWSRSSISGGTPGALLAPILADAFQLLVEDGRPRPNIGREVTRLFRTNFERWTGLHDAKHSIR